MEGAWVQPPYVIDCWCADASPFPRAGEQPGQFLLFFVLCCENQAESDPLV